MERKSKSPAKIYEERSITINSSHEVEKQSEWVQLVTSTSTNIFPNLKGQMDVIFDYKTYMHWSSSSSEIDVPLRICYSAMRKILTMKQM